MQAEIAIAEQFLRDPEATICTRLGPNVEIHPANPSLRFGRHALQVEVCGVPLIAIGLR